MIGPLEATQQKTGQGWYYRHVRNMDFPHLGIGFVVWKEMYFWGKGYRQAVGFAQQAAQAEMSSCSVRRKTVCCLNFPVVVFLILGEERYNAIRWEQRELGWCPGNHFIFHILRLLKKEKHCRECWWSPARKSGGLEGWWGLWGRIGSPRLWRGGRSPPCWSRTATWLWSLWSVAKVSSRGDFSGH